MNFTTAIKLFSAFILINNCIHAQDLQQQLDGFFNSLSKNEAFNGAVLVAENAKIVYQKSFGYSNFENKILNENTTQFQIASVSKVFTAVAILQLLEKGNLKLDDEYVKYYPDFPYPAITIRQLLSHSSGMSDQDISDAISNYDERKNGSLTNDQLVPFLANAKVKLKLAPGEKWWYSNLGYELLATLVEKLSNKTFSRYITEHIFLPAGMKYTYLKSYFLPAQDSSRLADNYDYEFRYSNTRIKMEGEKSYYNQVRYGNSNVISTTGDLLLFDIALYEGKLLKNSTLNEAYTPTLLNDKTKNFVWKNIGGMGNAFDGLGWFIFEDTTIGKIVWHAGGMQGCATILLRNTTRHQTVVFLDNTSSEGLYKNGLNVINILNNKPTLPVKKSMAKIYGKAFMSKGETYAFCLLHQYMKDTSYYNLSENDMNNLGYEFLSNNHIPQAIETFKINTLLYPESDNVYNSYAEALQKVGKKEEAIMMLKKSLLINPQNEESQKTLKSLIAE